MAGSTQTAPHFRYAPTLRTKAGEAKALGQLLPTQKSRIFPVFQVTSDPPATFGTILRNGWPHPIALDGLYNYTQTGSVNAYNTLFSDLRQLGLTVIPSVDVAAVAPYVANVHQLLSVVGPELVVRASLTTLGAATAWVASNGWLPNNIHLIIDAGHVAEYDPASYASYVISSLTYFSATMAPWRSVTLSSSSGVKDASGAAYGLNLFPRRDWALWNAVAPTQNFRLDFGDFGFAHRDLTEPPGAAMARATVSVRYTIDNDWIFIKGRQTGGPQGIGMHQQYQAHATMLVQHPSFGGIPGCWADGVIQAIAAGSVNAGSRQTWACKSMNRHLSKVSAQLP